MFLENYNIVKFQFTEHPKRGSIPGPRFLFFPAHILRKHTCSPLESTARFGGFCMGFLVKFCGIDREKGICYDIFVRTTQRKSSVERSFCHET
jgi:hypothetical protein